MGRLDARLESAMRSVSVRKLVRVLGAIVALGTALSIPIGYVIVGGAAVSRVELTVSLLPLLTEAALIGVVTLVLGWLAYLIFAVLPLKVLDRSLGELTNAGEKTRRQNMLLDAALENMVQGLAMYDADERIVIANDRYAELYGLTPEQVKPGTTLREVVGLRAAQGHYPGVSVEHTYQTMRSRIRSLEPTHVLHKLADGRVIAAFVQPKASGGWVVTHQDVTERESLHALLAQQNSLLLQGEEQLKAHNHQLDAAARESRRGLDLLDAALNSLTQGLCMFDAERRLVVCNKVFLEMYSFRRDEVKPGTTARELVAMRHAKGLYGRNDAETVFSEWLADPSPDVTRIQHLFDGRIVSVCRRRLTDGGFVVMHEDITERHRLEQNERETRELLSAVFDAAPAAIISLDLEGRVMVWSRGAERMFGYTAEEAVDRPYPLVPEGMEEEFKGLLQRAVAGEMLQDTHVRRRHKNGTLLEVSIASSAMYNRDGTMRGIAYALTDITESEKLRKRIKEQHEQLDIALNNMSQGIAMFDADQHLVVCNSLYAKMFGLSPEQVRPGTTVSQILDYRLTNGCNDLASGTSSLDRHITTSGGVKSARSSRTRTSPRASGSMPGSSSSTVCSRTRRRS
jgi:PAS domain S-box-containing protein